MRCWPDELEPRDPLHLRVLRFLLTAVCWLALGVFFLGVGALLHGLASTYSG